MTPNSAMEEG
uniref:Uncharacterized protein n=1 Tax=Arundo donax TaxID=35708 RepID=A0A0A8YWR5_ARUDO